MTVALLFRAELQGLLSDTASSEEAEPWLQTPVDGKMRFNEAVYHVHVWNLEHTGDVRGSQTCRGHVTQEVIGHRLFNNGVSSSAPKQNTAFLKYSRSPEKLVGRSGLSDHKTSNQCGPPLTETS